MKFSGLQPRELRRSNWFSITRQNVTFIKYGFQSTNALDHNWEFFWLLISIISSWWWYFVCMILFTTCKTHILLKHRLEYRCKDCYNKCWLLMWVGKVFGTTIHFPQYAQRKECCAYCGKRCLVPKTLLSRIKNLHSTKSKNRWFLSFPAQLPCSSHVFMKTNSEFTQTYRPNSSPRIYSSNWFNPFKLSLNVGHKLTILHIIKWHFSWNDNPCLTVPVTKNKKKCN